MKTHFPTKRPQFTRHALLAACANFFVVAAGSQALAAAPSRVTVASDVPASLSGVVETAAPATIAPMTVNITLPLSDEAGAAKLADSVSTPGNALYGHYLTPAQFAQKFGANAADYAAVIAWAKAQGLALHAQNSARTIVSVVGTRAQIEQAFGVTFKYYQDKTGRVFPSAANQPTLPATIAAKIDSVLGLSRRVGIATHVKHHAISGPRTNTAGGTGPGGYYSPADFRTAYAIPGAAVGGPAETMAVFEQGGFFASDVSVFTKANKLTLPSVTVRGVDGYQGGVDNPDVELESVLDIDTIIGITQGTANILVYEDGEDFGVALLDSLAAMADDDKATVISISYGEDEVLTGEKQMKAEHRAFVQLAAQGQEVLVSSGDEGAYGDEGFGLNVADPCSQPYVTCVGGTTLFTGQGQAYSLENVWNDLANYEGATGGGVSSLWALPAYQVQPESSPVVSVASFNGGSNTFRNVPDVSADADPLTGAAIYSKLNGGWLAVGGTSLASPLYAGFLGVYDQTLQIVSRPHVGFYNPTLYGLGTTFYGYYSFHDIRNGSNGDVNEYSIPGYSAGYNYDNASGWGSPFGPNLLTILLSDVTGDKHPPKAPNGMTGSMTGTTISVAWTPVAGVPGYIAEVVDPYTGAIISSDVTVAPNATFTRIAAKLPYYAVYLYSINKTGSTEGPPLYLQAP